MTPRVVVIFAGGTIASMYDAAAGGNVATLTGQDLLARTPGLDAIADVEAIDWGRTPASHLSFDQVIDLARTVREALERPGVAGAVVAQGTDTIEETAFALDLLTPGDRPVVVTGAMRAASDEGYEGPVNLRAAVRVAADPAAAGQGALVVLDGRILPADDATKTHTTSYATFQALNAGPIGTVDDAGVRIHARRAGRRVLPALPEHAAEPVPLVTATLGEDGRTVRILHEAGLRGLVVAATGTGNTHPGLLAAAVDVMQAGYPVVLATRAASGSTRPAYAFPGGGAQWARFGAILAGPLPALKARVLLALALGAGLDGDALRALFMDRPTASSG